MAAKTQEEQALEYTVALLRAAALQSREVLAVLEDLESELSGMILQRDEFKPGTARLKSMLTQAQEAIAGAYADINDGQTAALERIAATSGKQAARALNTTIGVDVFGSLLSAQTLRQIVKEPVVLGHSAASWWTGQETATKARFVRAMQLGTMLGETNDQLARRVRGTKAAGFTDGIMSISRREAVGLVRTSAISIANNARLRSFEEADDVVAAIMWSATLDSRTTLICRALDRKRWSLPDYKPIEHDKAFPGATAHFACRSNQVAVTKTWAELSGKKIKPLDNRTLQKAIEDRLEEEGRPPEQIAGALARARASMDGQVPAAIDMQKWIEQKGVAYAESVLGPGRATLFNDGRITITEMTDQTNRPLTLAELEAYVESGKQPPETLGLGFAPEPSDTKSQLKAKARTAAAKIEELQRKLEQARKE